jgi:hypothetical protein
MSDHLQSSIDAPEHLRWSLNDFDNHRRAIDFVQRFSENLCVFSTAVEQLFTNFTIIVPENLDRTLVILPNPYAFHDTFHGVEGDAVTATGLRIVPCDDNGTDGLFLEIPLKGHGGASRTVPLSVGLRMLDQRLSHTPDGFLPVITKGDLRSFRQDLPSLHLHRISPSKLTKRSRLEQDGIKHAIQEKLDMLKKDLH